MAESLLLRLTGAPVLRVGGRDCPLDGLTAVLAARLALDGPQPRADIAAWLWPDADTARARANLRQRLLRLRQQTGVEWVVGDATLALASALEVAPDPDPLAAELLQGVRLQGSDELERWLDQQRRLRRAQGVKRLQAQVEQACAAQDWAAAEADAWRWVSLEPLIEAPRRLLAQVLYLSGDSARAHDALVELRAVLRRELAALPDAATLALEALVAQGRSARPPAAAVSRPAAQLALARPPCLVGRDGELQRLRDAVSAERTAVLAGAAGLGKSRLLDALARELAAGSAVLHVGARAGDAAVPLALAARWLQALLRILETAGAVAPDAAQRRQLAALNPAWRSPQAERLDPSATAHAATQLLQRAAEAGLRAVLIDDLHFADGASVVLLAAVAAHAAGGAPAWVLATRPDEGDAALAAWLQALRSASGCDWLDLAPLDPASFRQLLDALQMPGVGGDTQALALQRATGGNPFFLLETLKALPGDAPPPDDVRLWPRAPVVQRLILQRLQRLSPAGLQLLRCAGIAGPELRAGRIARLLNLHPLELAEPWAELESAQVLSGERFTHDLLAEAAAAAVPQAVAAELHGALAQQLEAEDDVAPGRVAAHWLAAGLPLRAAPLLVRAGRAALAQGLLLDAGRLFVQAARLLQDGGSRSDAFDAWFDAAQALSEAERPDDVRPCADAMDALAQNDEQRAGAACARAYLLVEHLKWDDVLRCAREGLACARRAGSAELEVELMWTLIVVLWEQRDVPAALDHAERALARAEAIDPGRARLPPEATRAKLRHAAAVMAGALGRTARAEGHLQKAVQSALAHGAHRRATECLSSLRFFAQARGDGAGVKGRSDEFQHALAALPADDRAALDHLRLEGVGLQGVLGDLGQALSLADDAMRALDVQGNRVAHRLAQEACALYDDLGRRDLAMQGLNRLHAVAADLAGPDRLRLRALDAYFGRPTDVDALLAAISEVDDTLLREKLLCRVQPGCASARVQPLLTLAARSAAERGDLGSWVTMQACRVSACLSDRQVDEAATLARATWASLEQGTVGWRPLPALAAPLCAALAGPEPDLALRIALHARAWLLRAVQSLPPMWRESCLGRAPWLALPPARERAVWLGLPGAPTGDRVA